MRTTPRSKAVGEGECVVVYPEGTLTRDPDLWPMKGKTGAARIALATGCPVIPVGQWGAQEVLPPYAKRPHLVPRKHIDMKAGDPVDLDDLRRRAARPPSRRRGDRPDHGRDHRDRGRAPRRDGTRPALRPARSGVREIGNPHKRPDGATKKDRRPMTQGRSVRCRVVGHRLLASCWPTPATTCLCGRGARRSCEAINERRENTDYLPGIELPPSISAPTDPEEVAADADVVVLTVPSQTLRENLTAWAPVIPEKATLVSLMKGVELGSLMRMSEVIAGGHRRLGRPDRRRQRTQPGARDRPPRAGRVRRRLRSTRSAPSASRPSSTRPSWRPYTSVDVLGCEIGGAYKNVVGLAVGMAVGLGFGDNTTASVITRGLAETARLATAQGANPLTLMGLAGLGDLVATCSSPLSRNRTFGEKPRPGHDDRGDLRLHPSGRRGREVLQVPAGARPPHGRRRPDRRAVDAVVDGKMTALDMMNSFIARDTKPETD